MHQETFGDLCEPLEVSGCLKKPYKLILYIYIIYLGQFKAILNHFVVISGPFVDPLGTILGRFWGYLEPSQMGPFGHGSP